LYVPMNWNIVHWYPNLLCFTWNCQCIHTQFFITNIVCCSFKKKCILVIAERCARSSTSMATWTSPPSSCVMQGGTGASYSFHDH
jgi:hypothetical protein